MGILTWVLFVLSNICLIAVVLMFIFSLESEEPIGVIFVYFITFLFAAFSFYISRDLFSLTDSLWVWKIENVVCVMGLIICYISNHDNLEIAWPAPVLLSIVLGLIPFIIRINFDSRKVTSISSMLLADNLNAIILFWLPLVTLLAIGFAVFYSVISRSLDRSYKKHLRYYLDRFERFDLYGSRREIEMEVRRSSEFSEKIFRNLFEEFQSNNEKNLRKIDELIRRQKDATEHAYSILNRETRSLTSLIPPNNNYILGLASQIEDIKSSIKALPTSNHVGEIGLYANSNNQNFIRELFHFLITPLSQIEAKSIIFSQEEQVLLANGSQFRKAVSTIKASVEMCKSVLAAYRELAFVTSSSDWSPESLNQSILAAGNLYKESSEKEVRINSDIPDRVPPYSNNYLLAVLLPLLENAIKASPPNKDVCIKYTSAGTRINILIENEAINMPTLKNLSIPGFSSKKDHKGTGLLIARHLVEDHNNGSLIFNINSNIITTTISIPQREMA